MNVLITVDNEEYGKCLVMLASIFTHYNFVNISCIENNLDKDKKEYIKNYINSNNSKVEFFQLEDIQKKCKYSNYKKIAHILYSYSFFSKDCNKVIYISNDTIINDNIDDFYNKNINDYLIMARGQTLTEELKELRIGARPEKGQIFDARVLLINLEKLRDSDIDKMITETRMYYDKEMGIQPLINCFFRNNVLINYNLEYNVRYSIYTDAEKRHIDFSNIKKRIISYEHRDYYDCGKKIFPWLLVLHKDDIAELMKIGYLKEKYELRKSFRISIDIMELWHLYVKKSELYEEINSIANDNRNNLINNTIKNQDFLEKSRQEQRIINRIKNNEYVSEIELDDIKYNTLIKHIDSIPENAAISIMNNLFSINKENIRKKMKCKVGFVVNSSSEWQCEMLYRKLEEDVAFEPKIIVARQIRGTEDVYEKLFEKTMAYFEDNYNVVSEEILDQEIDTFDVLVYISPYNMYPDYMNVQYRKLSQLILHIPYAYYIVNKEDAHYITPFYERAIMKLAWGFLVPSNIDKQMAYNHQRLKAYNVKVCGFPKMDEYITNTFTKRTNLWKAKEDIELKVIWAPHFNMEKGMNGTFNLNYRWFLDYAKKHSEISWIVRPHPRFTAGVIAAGVFRNKEEVAEYFEEWNNLENAQVIDGGGYYDIFSTSDAMILDSTSFLAEYQFTEKPLLFLYPEEPRSMNELGKELLEVVYKTKGNNFEEIDTFILNCKNKRDSLKETRKEFFSNYLDYYNLNKKLATDYIFNLLKSMVVINDF